tara:strand:+ start:1396 stop:4494 length:3099 start_codon:yes stop_codon:yes gene_type:complete
MTSILNNDLTTTNSDIRIPISYNNYSFADSSKLLTNLTSNNKYIDLTDSGYTLNYKPSSKNSKIHVRAKINYVCSKCNSELISFRLLRKIKGNSQPLVLMNDCSLGSFFGVTNYNIYNLEYIDTPSTLNEITYYLNYKIHNSNNNINNKSGILGYDLSNHNFFCAQEIYIPEIEQYCSDTYINQDLNYNYPIIIIGTAGNNTMFYSINNSKTWISLGKTIFEESCNDIIWSDETKKFIAVGKGSNCIAYSNIYGKEWRNISSSSNIFSHCGNAIVWSGFKFVAVGEGNNTIAYSGDGLNWYIVHNSIDIFDKGYNITYGNNRYICVGSGKNTLAYSDDGINWIGLGKSIFNIAAYAIFWTGKRWIAGGEGNFTLAYSDDNGLNWTGLNSTIFNKNVLGFAMNNNIIVAVGNGKNNIAYSIDHGLNWININGVFSKKHKVKNVSWVGNYFIACSSEPNNFMQYSYNGIDWFRISNYNGSFITEINTVATNISYLNKYENFNLDISLDNLRVDKNLETNNIISKNLNILSQEGKINTQAKLDISLISLNGSINLMSNNNLYIKSNDKIIIESNDKTIIKSNESNITEIISGLIVDNILIKDNSIMEKNGNELHLKSLNDDVVITSLSGTIKINPSLEIANLNLFDNTILSNNKDFNIIGKYNVNIVSQNELKFTSGGKINFESNNKSNNIIDFGGATLQNIDKILLDKTDDFILPKGIITMWSGSDHNIPSGWVLCDGKNGTPDLRGRFILASTGETDISNLYGENKKNTFNTNSIGGQHDNYLTLDELPNHSHEVSCSNYTFIHDHSINSVIKKSYTSHNHNALTYNTESSYNHNHDLSYLITSDEVNISHKHNLNNHSHNIETHNDEHNHEVDEHSHNANITIPYSLNDNLIGNKSIITDGMHTSTMNLIDLSNGTKINIDNCEKLFTSVNKTIHNHGGKTSSVELETLENNNSHLHKINSTIDIKESNNTHNHKAFTTIQHNEQKHSHNIDSSIYPTSSTHNHDISLNSIGANKYYNNMPAYYVLAFIMKI